MTKIYVLNTRFQDNTITIPIGHYTDKKTALKDKQTLENTLDEQLKNRVNIEVTEETLHTTTQFEVK